MSWHTCPLIFGPSALHPQLFHAQIPLKPKERIEDNYKAYFEAVGLNFRKTCELKRDLPGTQILTMAAWIAVLSERKTELAKWSAKFVFVWNLLHACKEGVAVIGFVPGCGWL